MEIETHIKQQGVVEVILNRAEKRNALSVALLDELSKVLKKELPNTRLLILRGNGSIFCAGLDLKEALEVSALDALGPALRDVLIQLVSAPCITVAAIQGAALAGGAGLMAACDLCIAEAGTQIGFPEVLRGLVPSLIAPIVELQLQRRHLNELFYFGDNVSAERAYEMGLINHVAPKGGMNQAINTYIHRALQTAPNAVAQTKKLLDRQGNIPLADKIYAAYEEHHLMRRTDEAHEGVAAFLEKRTPSWVISENG